jgi:hypothetical protein
MVIKNAGDITIAISDLLEDIVYKSAEFEHLRAFLNDYIHDNYQMWIAKGNTDYIVTHMNKGHHPYHHHSFSNCVEWVFNNCELDKE